jgi:hypothetical protein
VAITRAELATIVHYRLGRLAQDRQLTTAPSGLLTEGNYTYSINAGLREIGVDDIADVQDNQINSLIAAVEQDILVVIQRDYALETDYSQGDLSQSLSQISKAVGAMISGGNGSGGRSIVVRKLTRNSYSE